MAVDDNKGYHDEKGRDDKNYFSTRTSRYGFYFFRIKTNILAYRHSVP
jgi:hypothetical protein